MPYQKPKARSLQKLRKTQKNKNKKKTERSSFLLTKKDFGLIIKLVKKFKEKSYGRDT